MLTMDTRKNMPADSVPRPVVAAPKPGFLDRSALRALPGMAPQKRRTGADRRGQFSLLIVRGDGERVLRFNFPKPAAIGVAAIIAATVSLGGLLDRKSTRLNSSHVEISYAV